jgi:putative ABC transport system permease protein
MNSIQLVHALNMGLIYAILAMAVLITFRWIDFPDLTVDGSFTLGAGVAATLLLHDYHLVVAISAAMLSGAIAGTITAYLHIRWRILGLLAGILTMIALYSINLRIMGMPNIAILNVHDWIIQNPLLCTVSVVTMVLLLLYGLFSTDLGYSIRAVGLNPRLCSAYGINQNQMKTLALALSNSLVALSGALFALLQGFADIGMGQGTIIYGLAAVIIGEALLPSRKVGFILLSCILGAIIYRVIIACALNMQLPLLKSQDLSLITAALVAACMMLTKHKRST